MSGEAWRVYSSGIVVGNLDSYVGVSYGYFSPYTGWMQYSLANLLSPEGEAILTDGSISVFDSYGKYSICLYIISLK